MHSSSPTDSSRSASTTSDSPHAWPSAPTPTIRPPQVRRKPVPSSSSRSPALPAPVPATAPAPAPTVLKSRRFYSSPLSDDSPDPKTPLQAYGLEQREPSIILDDASARPNKLLRRVSHALDDIKEDFSLQLDSRGTADRMRCRRRESAFFEGPPVAMPSPLGALRHGRPETAASRPLSIFSLDFHAAGGPTRRLSRRLSMLGNNLSQRGRKRFQSISQPNLIGSSTHM